MPYAFNPFTGNLDYYPVAAASGITIGTTTITSGTDTRIPYNNAGVVGEYTLTGTGTVVVMKTAPTITGPATISEAVGSSGLTVTGATQTTNKPAINVTQTWNSSGVTFNAVTIEATKTAGAAASNLLLLRRDGFDIYKFGQNGDLVLAGGASITGTALAFANTTLSGYLSMQTATGTIYFGSGAGDLQLTRKAAATMQMGADVNGAAVAQFFGSCAGITGTDKAGANMTFFAGPGTGAVTPAVINFQTSTAVASGTTAQTLATRFTIATGLLTVADATDFAFNATTGTKHGTATSQKQSFWNATPIVQPTTGVAAATFVTNTSGIVNDTGTWDGYTVGQVVKALRNIGLLA